MIYHAPRAVLARVDAIQTRFLRDAGMSELAALMEFNLAPLGLRRDIAMLVLLFCTARKCSNDGQEFSCWKTLTAIQAGSILQCDGPNGGSYLCATTWGAAPRASCK